MMKFLFFAYMVFNALPVFCNDSVTIRNQRRFSIETGVNSSIFLSSRVKNNFINSYTNNAGITNIGFGYCISEKYKFYLLYTLSRGDFESSEKGSIIDIHFQHLSTGMQKKIISKNRFQDFIHFSLNYRIGGEAIYYDRYFIETIEDGFKYHSFGIGAGNGLSYKIGKRFLLSADVGYYYFFDKKRDTLVEYFKNYKPVRNVITGNFKIGFLL